MQNTFLPKIEHAKITFQHLSIPELGITNALIPAELGLESPSGSLLPQKDQHFLLYIPWQERYINHIPPEFRAFFRSVIKYLHVRTTDVHTALCMSFLDGFLSSLEFAQDSINRRVVALALMLHDSGWSKLSDAEVAYSLGVTGLKLTDNAIGPKEKHAVESEGITRKVLSQQRTTFNPALSEEETELICKAVRYHDKPELVAGSAEPMPLEVQVLVDLDHLWSFTLEGFWLDTLRKGVDPDEYARNLKLDLHDYFVTHTGKTAAQTLLEDRMYEVRERQALITATKSKPSHS